MLIPGGQIGGDDRAFPMPWRARLRSFCRRAILRTNFSDGNLVKGIYEWRALSESELL